MSRESTPMPATADTRLDPELHEALTGHIERFDHVSVGVQDIASLLPLVSLLDGRFRGGGDDRANGYRFAQWDLPGAGKLEAIQPLDADDASNFLVRFLAGHGEGLHHLTFKVHDRDAAVDAARDAGFDVVGVAGDGTWREAFIHPRSANGVLIQLAQWSGSTPSDDLTIEDVLAGRGEQV